MRNTIAGLMPQYPACKNGGEVLALIWASACAEGIKRQLGSEMHGLINIEVRRNAHRFPLLDGFCVALELALLNGHLKPVALLEQFLFLQSINGSLTKPWTRPTWNVQSFNEAMTCIARSEYKVIAAKAMLGFTVTWPNGSIIVDQFFLDQGYTADAEEPALPVCTAVVQADVA